MQGVAQLNFQQLNFLRFLKVIPSKNDHFHVKVTQKKFGDILLTLSGYTLGLHCISTLYLYNVQYPMSNVHCPMYNVQYPCPIKNINRMSPNLTFKNPQKFYC